LTGAAADVMHVPNAALRFRPTEEMLSAAGIEAPAGARGNPAQTGGARAAGRGAERGQAAAGRRDSASRGGQEGERGRSGTLWYVNEAGTLATLRVRTGISDGKSTQVEGAGLRPGMQVIVGVLQGDQPAGATASPFGGGQRPQGGGGGPRGPF
ncbi:MAG TPA: hypothetical protein VEW03_16455, partial [Longimicrobiaceae bacterium]|nr:hypothetical protein [Longimicrobiaceae bacterium]